jgi:glycosyltransferase involved in cell wall biosynthesis
VLLLAGRLDPMTDCVKALAFDLRLHDSVKFLGSVDDIAGLLNAVELGVFSSPMESSPNGVLECMAAGLPVVASDLPGVREVVGEAGLFHLAPPGDAASMADRIVALALHPQKSESLSKANRERIANYFSIEHMGESMTQLIADALRH